MVWEKTYFCPQEIIVIMGSGGCNSTSEIRCSFRRGLHNAWDRIEDRTENLLVWKSAFSFHTVLNDWTCSEVLFSWVQSRGSKAVEFSGNHGFFHSVNAFCLKAKHSPRTHCLLQIFNWNRVRGFVICTLNSQLFSNIVKTFCGGLMWNDFLFFITECAAGRTLYWANNPVFSLTFLSFTANSVIM